MGRVGDDELRFSHRASYGAGRDVTLTLAPGGLHFGRAFGFLVFVPHFLMAHLEALLLAHPLDRKIDERDHHEPGSQREDQRDDGMPGRGQLRG